MGMPMATRLLDAGFTVHGADSSPAALECSLKRGGKTFATAREACAGVSLVITMLPTGAIVRDVLLGAEGAAQVLAPEALVIDMSSSAPMGTRALAEDLKALGIGLIDAPVSGGVQRAADGSLAIMAGGDPAEIARARPLLEAMGKSIFIDRARGLRPCREGAQQLRLGGGASGRLRGGHHRPRSSASTEMCWWMCSTHRQGETIPPK